MSNTKKDPLYYSAKMRCRALIAYGRSDEFIEKELRDGFWPDTISEQIIGELSNMRNQKITFKSNVQLPRFK
jgi:hypothetical protein